MKRIKQTCLLLVSVLILVSIIDIPVEAGRRIFSSDIFTASGELNNTDWNSTDQNIVLKNGKLVIPAKTSTDNTKYISKSVATASKGLKTVVEVESTMQITALPKNQKFILGLGLSSIEASPEEDGNIEIVFVNEGELRVSVFTYGDNGKTTVVNKKKCNFSLNTDFKFEASVSGEQVLVVKLNGETLCNKKIDVKGSGRFGMMQTGSCGAVISKLHATCYRYDSPENADIVVDFEKNEWNKNLLNAQLFNTNGMGVGTMKIEDYNGSKVLRVRNAGWTSTAYSNKISSYLMTKYEYSNFEMSFDVPYFQRTKIFDDKGNQIGKPCDGIYLAFGVDIERPTPIVTNAHNTDAIIIGSDYVTSVIRPDVKVPLKDFKCFKEGTNEGFSVKLTMIDGIATLQMKSLKGNDWKTVTTQDYTAMFAQGYVAIWSYQSGDYAIDNLNVSNKDANPKLINVEYESSIMTAEDYVPTEEDFKMVFRDGSDKLESDSASVGGTLTVAIVISVVSVTIVLGTIVILLLVKKQKKGENKNENK